MKNGRGTEKILLSLNVIRTPKLNSNDFVKSFNIGFINQIPRQITVIHYLVYLVKLTIKKCTSKQYVQ